MIQTKLIPGKRYYLFTKECSGVYRFKGGDSGIYYFTDLEGDHEFNWPVSGYYGFIIDPTCGEVPTRKVNFELNINWS